MTTMTVTVGGKVVDVGSIEIEGIDWRDYPDLCDVSVSAAEFEDGTPLTEDECWILFETYGSLIHSIALERAF